MASEQERLRQAARLQLMQSGIDPYPAAAFQRTHNTASLLAEADTLSPQQTVRLAGRLMERRIMGKASFAELQDAHGRIQLYLNRDDLGTAGDGVLYNEVFKKQLDFGDWIGVEGFLFTTQTGERSVHVRDLTVLAKTLRPLPVVKIDSEGHVHDGFTDPELRYRMRYVDLIVNPEVKTVFLKRSRMVQAMREFFLERGYLEVDTPVLQPIPGGATARPFITHHNALDVPLYLRIANELYLKRLIVGGFEGVFEFARDFRNEGMDRTHNPEFTILEIYVAFQDYRWMMEFTEQLIEHTARAVNGRTEVTLDNRTIELSAPFARVSMRNAILEHTSFDIHRKSEDEIRAFCVQESLEVGPEMGKGKLIDTLFGERCEKHYVQPTFITDYPIEMSPLCKRHRDDPDYTERFELMINGKELANAYSELNDPIDQRERFEEQLRLSQKGDDEAMFIDHDFLRALEFGMPPTAGMGIGIDRLAMLLTAQSSIQEVLFFPQMRPEALAVSSARSGFDGWALDPRWIGALTELYGSPEALRELKPTQVHQQLNGLRKKNKWDVPALLLDEVQAWFV
ncbi:lysine--tRNA ligase [bacterium]|nr:lysine--tRNA ligase [bacterium]